MSTRSLIAIKQKDNTVKSVYCHWDGYLEHNGIILSNHYNTYELADKLVSIGDISSLGEKCDKPDGHTFASPVDGYTIYYSRDRGEENATPIIYADVESWIKESKNSWSEYLYLFADGQWHVTFHIGSRFKELTPLKEALKAVKE